MTYYVHVVSFSSFQGEPCPEKMLYLFKGDDGIRAFTVSLKGGISYLGFHLSSPSWRGDKGGRLETFKSNLWGSLTQRMPVLDGHGHIGIFWIWI